MKKNILILGSGFGGVYTLKHLNKLFPKKDRVNISMISDKNYFFFTPLLHEVAAGSINPSNITEPVREIMERHLNDFYLGKVSFINLAEKFVTVNKKNIPYDFLIIAMGATTNFFNTPGASEYALTLKSIEDAVRIKDHCIAQVDKSVHIRDSSERKKMLKFVLVGGGPTGVELAAELSELLTGTLSHYYPKEIINDISIMLIQRGAEIVPQFGSKIRMKSLEILQKKNIEVMLNSAVKEIKKTSIIINEGTSVDTETVIWAAGAKPVDVMFDQVINKTPDGRLIVNEYVQLPGFKEVFVVGDMSAFTDKGGNTLLPALAQVAQKESGIVAKNIKSLMENKPLQEFKYKNSGNLLSLGQWMAAGEIDGITFYGKMAWWFWRTVYLSKLLSFRKKVRVAMDWTINIFYPRDISQS